ncbi:hypothetical protein OG331_31470 [Streptomyces sp. NBC_01017]|uniref:hypothetical protein n=1 Tax=Streptomyces sp. NBC_01017 TaxID=2903721 RepID=UPI0038644BF3|nr:hypothetical protein OG331_31470 [Streptomyces sp. NBC_01017]
MALPTFTQQYEAGDAWLANSCAHPNLVRDVWASRMLAPIPSGEEWLVAEARLATGYPRLVRIRAEQRGPVLADPVMDVLWWLVPLHAPEKLADVRQLAVKPSGWSLHCPPTGWQIEGRMWITRPDGSGRLTDPAVLAAAFGPGGYRLPAEASR